MSRPSARLPISSVPPYVIDEGAAFLKRNNVRLSEAERRRVAAQMYIHMHNVGLSQDRKGLGKNQRLFLHELSLRGSGTWSRAEGWHEWGQSWQAWERGLTGLVDRGLLMRETTTPQFAWEQPVEVWRITDKGREFCRSQSIVGVVPDTSG